MQKMQHQQNSMRHLMTLRYVDAVARAGSIRRAAENLALTASALNRRIQAFEDEWGVQLFERLPSGVRLNSAGELVLRHIRAQMADVERLRSQIADLSGVRRGHVNIACSQAAVPYFLTAEIAAYRRHHPGVTFGVKVQDRFSAERSLSDFSVDLALVFNPAILEDFRPICAVKQRIVAILGADHPLAKKTRLRLRECLAYPLALPDRGYGGREMLEAAVRRSSFTLEPILESSSFEFLREYVASEPMAITFQIAVGAPDARKQTNLVSIPLDERDVEGGELVLGQLSGRTLPVASARFADQVATRMSDASWAG